MIPVAGKNQEWDSLNKQIDELNNQFEKHLKVVHRQLG